MNEYILASAVGPYETVTLKLIEPDYETVSQSFPRHPHDLGRVEFDF